MLTIFEIAARPEKEPSWMKLETSPWENIAIRVHAKLRAVYHHAANRRSERQITHIVCHTQANYACLEGILGTFVVKDKWKTFVKEQTITNTCITYLSLITLLWGYVVAELGQDSDIKNKDTTCKKTPLDVTLEVANRMIVRLANGLIRWPRLSVPMSERNWH